MGRQDNIKMDLKELECVDVYWIYLARAKFQWRNVLMTKMNFQVPKGGEALDLLSDC
jgi:hypothetical protein